MGFLIPAAIGLGASLLGGAAKKKGEIKQAKAQDKAARETFAVKEKSRTNQNAAAQALLNALFGGKYAVDPAAFGSAQQLKPYTGADTSAGMGWGALGNAISGAGDIATMYALSKYPQPPASTAPSAGASVGGADLGLPDVAMDPNITAPYPAAPAQVSLTPWDQENL